MANFRCINMNFLRTALTDYFFSVGNQASRDTVTVDTNSTGSLHQQYPAGAQATWVCICDQYLTANFGRKASVSFRFWVGASYPAVDTIMCQVGNSATDALKLSTNGKLKIGTTESTDAAVGLNAFLLVEYIIDMDWRGASLGSVLARQNGNATVVQVDSLASTTIDKLSFGSNGSKVQGPNCDFRFNHVYAWYSDDAGNRAPWINAKTVEQNDRVPIADSASNNDFTGTPNNTNKFNNVKDSPSDGATSYNYGGDSNTTKNSSNTFTAVTYSPDTPLGFTIYNVRAKGDGAAVATYSSLVRDNSINYTAAFTNLLGAGYNVDILGYPGRPADNSTLTSAILNSLEGGVQVLTGTISSGQTQNLNPNADGLTYDGVWTQTGGTAGLAYTCINDVNDATYISSTALNEKQGFKVGWSPTPANIGDMIVDIYWQDTGRSKAAETNEVTLGVRIGGVDYLATTNHKAVYTTNTFATAQRGPVQWSGSSLNPATGVRWTQSDITSAEWFLQHTTAGATGVDVSAIIIQPRVVSRLLQTASFMVVSTGTAFTSNGAIPRSKNYLYNQSVNRSGVY